jgi:hypothetical protein
MCSVEFSNVKSIYVNQNPRVEERRIKLVKKNYKYTLQDRFLRASVAEPLLYLPCIFLCVKKLLLVLTRGKCNTKRKNM